MMADLSSSFNGELQFAFDIQFCPICGSILPLPSSGLSEIACTRCSFKRNIKEYAKVTEIFTIHFNNPSAKKKKSKEQSMEHTGSDSAGRPDETAFQGPTVDRPCPRCNHDIMTYTTRQTRSADEGQTVFYTCIKCKFQDIEYS